MKIGVATTTINTPHAIKLLRAYDSETVIFICGDEKTPPLEKVFHEDSSWGGNIRYYSPSAQRELGYACSDLIGWNCIQRRSIAILESVKWGADIIILWDDDNLPIDASQYFASFDNVLTSDGDPPSAGLRVTGTDGWFDPGRLLRPNIPHRGFPHTVNSDFTVDFVTNARIGVAAGLCLGDPDISAVDRISQHPTIDSVGLLGQSGVCVDPKRCWTVFNSQNTAFVRELAPCFLMVPQFGRYDDILASLICQRVMRETGHFTHFGRPFIWQQRNVHNLVNDMKAETWGMDNIESFAMQLDTMLYHPKDSVVGMVRHFYQMDGLPAGVNELAQTWCDDVSKIL